MVLNPELIKFSKRKRGEGATGKAAPHSPYRFHEQKTFFDVKSENLKFLWENNMWDLSLFIEQDIRDEKYLFLNLLL